MISVNFLVILLPALITAQSSDSIFTVVAPFTVRQGIPYNIHVRGFNTNKDINLSIRFTGRSETGDNVNIKKFAQITRDVSKASVVISTDTITKGNYSLIVEGENYSQKRSLTYSTKKNVFLIQFNKAVQLPGGTLQYRIFAIDSDTNAADPKEPNNVTITDPNGNLILFLNNVAFTKGKYENEFKLGSKTVFGTWKMRFHSGEELVLKSFEVAEYKLPLVSASLIIPQYNLLSAGKIPVTIDISYIFGGNPVGSARLTIYSYEKRQQIVDKNINITSTRTSFDLNMATDLQTLLNVSQQFQVSLSFNDPLTREYAYAYSYIQILSKIYRISAYGIDQDYLKPGLPYKFTVALKKYDGSPAPAGTRLQIIPQNPLTIPEQTLYLGPDGTVTSSIDAPIGTSYLKLKIVANDSDDGQFTVYSRGQRYGSFLEVKILNPSCSYSVNCAKLNEPVNVKLTSGDVVDYAVVHLIAKGVLVKTLTIWFNSGINDDDDPKTVYFSFVPTGSYLPETQILAYYVNSYGNFIIGEGVTSIKYDLPNYVKIKPALREVKPGSNVKFSVESLVNSTVSLAAIDQRVLRQRSGENITLNSVFSDFSKFQTSDIKYDWENIEDYELRFSRKGLLILSNLPRRVSTFMNEMTSDIVPSINGDLVQAASDSSHLKIREDFSQTFLWRDVDIKNTLHDDESKFGYETITEKVPDSITNYFIYGVSMSSNNGMGLSEVVPSMSIFLPFFISVEFPYSMKRNEVLYQDIYIYNFLTQSQAVEIKISSDPKYEAVNLASNGWTASSGSYIKTITTKVGEHIKIQFCIRPKEMGLILFEITARGSLAGDGLKKQLRVIPNGIARSITRNVLIPIKSSRTTITETLKCNLPPSAYQDTTEISATVSGDLFVKTLNNIENLISLPSGCCEQIASSFIPNIVVHRYLTFINKLTPGFKVKLETNIAKGYQNLLRCQKSDGSFAIFSGGNSSTWVTAYIIQYLNLAADIVTIDPNIITKGADFLVSQQQADGSFFEAGNVNYYNVQTRSRKGVAMTAFCSIMFSSLVSKYPQYEDAWDESIDYLESQYKTLDSTYDLGIVAYALQLGDNGRPYKLFYEKRFETETMTSWILSTSEVNKTSYSYSIKPEDIEITSYGLMTAISREEVLSKILKIVQFLVSQTNRFGGYGSSHDTVIALNALSQFAEIYGLGETVSVTLVPDIGSSVKAEITPENIFTLHSFQLDPKARSLTAKASSKSSGLAIVSLTCDFYDNPYTDVPQFNLTYKIIKSCNESYTVEVCARYTPEGSSNMGILNVRMLSGFQGYSSDKAEGFKLIETINQGTELIFYFDSIDSAGYCVNVITKRTSYIANAYYGYIYAVDYYDTTKYSSISYIVPNLANKC